MTDDEQELVDALAEMARWFTARGETASSLICTRAAIHIAGTPPEERAITNAQMAERLRNDADHPASDLYDNEKMWLREAATVYEDMDTLYSAEPPPQNHTPEGI